MMPIIEVSPFLYRIRVLQTQRKAGMMEGLHYELGVGRLKLKNNCIFVNGIH